jgi:hypothetical protein
MVEGPCMVKAESLGVPPRLALLDPTLSREDEHSEPHEAESLTVWHARAKVA